MDCHQTQERRAIKKRSAAEFKTAGMTADEGALFHLGQIMVAR